ncbi:MAG: ABC transporter permease, partial [Acidobacteriota bacterium]
QEDTTSRLPLRFFVRGSSYQILGLFSSRWHLFGVDEPGRVFILGTDSVGRDYFSRLLYGAQISLTAGLVGTTISLGIALALGGLSGYCGGWLDDIAMRSAEVFLSLPWLYLLFAARAFLPLDVGPAVTFMVIVILLGLVGWAGPTRLVRGVVLIAREREFVDAARSFGASHLYLFWRHVFPQTLSVLLTQAALLVPMYVLAEVTLSFVGLGVAEPVPSWGNMLAALQQYHVLASSAWMFAPGVALVLITWLYHSLLSTLERRPVAVEL